MEGADPGPAFDTNSLRYIAIVQIAAFFDFPNLGMQCAGAVRQGAHAEF